MSNQQVPNEPPPSYDYVLDQRRPHDTAPASSGQSGNAGTTSAPNTGGASTSTSTSASASASNNAGPSTSSSTQQGTGSNAASGQNTGDKRKPKRGNSAHEELDVEEEDRPLPPGWVVQFSEKDDRFFFVDTMHPGGPRSIWTHPLDDPEWLSTVPQGMDPLAYVYKLWQDQPMPSPQPQAGPSSFNTNQGGAGPARPGYPQTGNPVVPGYRQGGTISMQQNYPGTSALQGGQRRTVTMEDLTQYYLSKMGTPEEWEKKHPRGKFSKLFHEKETAAQRQRRHAEHKARNLADELAYRAPVYRPGPYGYPGYGRYGGMYPGMGLSAGLLGLGAGAMLGTALF